MKNFLVASGIIIIIFGISVVSDFSKNKAPNQSAAVIKSQTTDAGENKIDITTSTTPVTATSTQKTSVVSTIVKKITNAIRATTSTSRRTRPPISSQEKSLCNNYVYITQWGTPGTGNGQFDVPSDVVADSFGNVYVTSGADGRIEKFDSNGNYISQLGGGIGTGNGQFTGPYGLTIDSLGNIYVSDRSSSRVQKFDSNGTYITQWGSLGTGNGQFGHAGGYTGAWGIDVDSSNNVYVVDRTNNRIEKFDSNGNYITQWGSLGTGNGQFNSPVTVAIDSQNNVYVTEVNNHRVQKFTSNGTYITQWGGFGTGMGPFGIAVDSFDDVFVVDSANNRVQKFDSNGNYITQWGSFGTGDGQFGYWPYGIDIDVSGNVYVVDTSNSRIEKFRPSCSGKIVIIKDTQPNNAQDFTFTRDFGANFLLDDDSNTTFSNTATFDLLNNGTYTISESATTGYNVSSISCVDPSGGTAINVPTRTATISISNGETITCTFLNQQNTPPPPPLLCITPPPNMISWWPGDTDGSDIESTSTINNGALQNGTTITLGKVANSFRFDGINDYVQVPNHASLTPSTNKFTFDFWMKPEQVTAAPKMLIYKGKEYRVMSDGANISFEVTNPSTGGKYVSTTTAPLSLNNWNFVAVTFDGSAQSLQIYVNGNLVPSTPNTLLSSGSVSTLINQPTNLRFGSDYGNSNYYKGYMDEIEFFNRTLTQTEIQSIFNADTAGKCKTTQQACVPDSWTQKANFGGVARLGATGFSIGTKGYIGMGVDGNPNGIRKDFWEYDQVTNVWTQKADFGGTARRDATGFSIGTKGYIGTGMDTTGYSRDFWEYNPSTNTWTQKANFGGTARSHTSSFSVGTKGYIGIGWDVAGMKNDFWEYNPSTNTWTQKANFGGGNRSEAASFSIGTKGYVGTGFGSNGLVNDFWEYNPMTNIWTQKTNFGGTARVQATGISVGTKGYIGTGWDGYNTKYRDFWEYNSSANTWIQRADFGGTARTGSSGFSINSKGYIGVGDDSARKQDFWEYCPL